MITLTLHVIEYPVMAPPLERRSTYLSGWAEARKFNTDNVWKDLTGSNEFNNAIGWDTVFCLDHLFHTLILT